MKTLLLTTPEGKDEAEAVDELVPKAPAGWRIETLPYRSLARTSTIPEVTVVGLDDHTPPTQVKSMIPELAHLQAGYPQGSYVLFALVRQALRNPKTRRRIAALLKEIRQSLHKFPNPDRVDIEVVQSKPDFSARLSLLEAKLSVSLPRPSPIDAVKEVVEAAQDLRADSGKLSAERIAKAYGVSVSKLAGWLGRSRQSVAKTPDSDSLQNELEFFERVARLRAAVTKDRFLKWLRMPNPQLDGATPLHLMAQGERQVVADLVDDVLTGAPT